MTKLLTKPKHEQLRQLVLDATLRRLTTAESLAYIKEKLGVKITDRYFFTVKKNIIDSSGQQLEYLAKNRNLFLSQYFERIAELQKHQREIWSIYEEAKEQGKRNFQLLCLKQLQEISVTITNLYNLLPEIKGLHFESDNEKYTGPQWATEKEAAEYSRECKFGVEDMNPEFQV